MRTEKYIERKLLASSYIYWSLPYFQGEELRITLAIIGEQKWEDALMEGKSPKAKQFVARTSNELKALMKIGIGDNFYNLRYEKSRKFIVQILMKIFEYFGQ